MGNANKLTAKEKALQINLDKRKYGTIVEIGAGQEVARQFFRAGAAAGTIAKTMSAYDMQMSNAVYGSDPNGRYVSRSRLFAMLEHEYNEVIDIVKKTRPKNTTFFAYAATVAAKSFKGNNECHAWCGVRLQLYPDAPPSDVILHVRMLDKEANDQQEALGVLGVNLIHGAYYFYHDPRIIIDCLNDNIATDRLEIDSIEFFGPYFEEQDNRLLNLHLIRSWKTRAIMFNPEGHVSVPAELLYKKNVLITRGTFKPFTKINEDMMIQGMKAFSELEGVTQENTLMLAEITLNQLINENTQVKDKDFIERVDQLSALGYHILISDYVRHFRLRAYFRQFTQKQMGIVMGMDRLRAVFNQDFYKGVEGGILEGFGKLFPDNTIVFAYPELSKSGEEINLKNVTIPENLQFLFKHLKQNGFIRGISNSNPELFKIESKKVLKQLQENSNGWEESVPASVAKLIKERQLFDYNTI